MPISDYLKGLRAAIGHEMILNPGVAAIIRDEAGRVLLQKRSDDGSWSLPAGAIDPGESPAQAVVREAYEETGLRVVPEKVAGVFGGEGFRHTYPNGDVIRDRLYRLLVPGNGRHVGWARRGNVRTSLRVAGRVSRSADIEPLSKSAF